MDSWLSYGSDRSPPGGIVWGVVVAVQANFYRVNLLHRACSQHLPNSLKSVSFGEKVTSSSLLCTRRSRLKKIGQRVMVGDWVRVEDADWAGGRGAIAEVSPRQTALDRPPIANADQILLMFALAEPDLDPQQLSRFLVKAESTGLQVMLCLNKQDLVSEGVCRGWQTRLWGWGYGSVVVSLRSHAVSGLLVQRLKAHITVVSGPSGVGKSSLINQLVPQAVLRTGAVSGKLGRGRHTTRHVELFELPGGGFLADTPGFNQPDLSLTPEALGQCFPEIRQRLAQGTCQFNDCLHRDEPGCAVGTDWERHGFYLTLLDEAMTTQAAARQQRDSEAILKAKVGEMGQIHHEPRLEAKKYRRVSRRSQKQALDDLRHNLPNAEDALDDRNELEDTGG